MIKVVRRFGILQYRQSCSFRIVDSGGLITGHIQHVGGGADEDDAFALTGACEFSILRQESVAGVDGFGAALSGDVDNSLNIEVSLDGVAFFTNEVGFVGFNTVGGMSIFPWVDCDVLCTQFMGCAEGADRDLAAVSDKNFCELLSCHSVLFPGG